MEKDKMECDNLRIDAARVKAEAARLGFCACGLSPAQPVDSLHADFFENWIGGGRHAGMGYMARNADLRLDPRRLMDGCLTVVSVALSYRPATPLPADRLQIAWYAYGADYHDVVRRKLGLLLDSLRPAFHEGVLQGRACCDTAPVLERYWAWRGGLGWLGRHTQLVIPRLGSAFFLGELLLNLEADRYDIPLQDGCGACRRCVEACPTGALGGTCGLDARRCLSYLTIEHKGSIPPEAAAAMRPYFYGCDRCLRACPHLRTAPPSDEPDFTPQPELLRMEEDDWMRLDVDQYRRLFKGSAVKRAKFEGLQRNLEALKKSNR